MLMAFPAHAGMNRHHRCHESLPSRVPRTRGDEPTLLLLITLALHAFPAHAGMNRRYIGGILAPYSVPRTRGDEPEAIPW